MNYRQVEVLCIAKDSVRLTEYISQLHIHGKYDAELALGILNQLIIEARMIMKGGGGPAAKANNESQFTKLGI